MNLRHAILIIVLGCGSPPLAMGEGPPEVGIPGEAGVAGGRPLPATAPEGPDHAERQSYTVQPGDTLSEIAQRFYGSPEAWKSLEKANPGLRPDDLKPGQVLHLPRSFAIPIPVEEWTRAAAGAVEGWIAAARRFFAEADRWVVGFAAGVGVITLLVALIVHALFYWFSTLIVGLPESGFGRCFRLSWHIFLKRLVFAAIIAVAVAIAVWDFRAGRLRQLDFEPIQLAALGGIGLLVFVVFFVDIPAQTLKGEFETTFGRALHVIFQALVLEAVMGTWNVALGILASTALASRS